MIRRKRRTDPTRFPQHAIDKEKVLQDTRNMEYLSKFREWHVKTVFYFALLGLTEEQIAVVFDISLTTLQAWKNKFPSFLDALTQGREQADAKVVWSLYQAAIGYEMETEQIFTAKKRTFDPATGKVIAEKTEIIRVPVTKKFPPSVKAATTWLAARQPGIWSTKKEIHKTITNQHQIDLKDLSVEELKLLSKLGVRGRDVEDAVFWTTAQKELAEAHIDDNA